MAMRRSQSIRVLAILVSVCHVCLVSLPAQQKALTVTYTPNFRVSVTLSDKARKTLTARKETIVVAAYFTGAAKLKTPTKYLFDQGRVSINESNIEIAPGDTAMFRPALLSPEALKWLDGSVNLLINVFSGRKSSPDNLLECGIYEGTPESVAGKMIPINCKLIRE